jgi:hypothetical protein
MLGNPKLNRGLTVVKQSATDGVGSESWPLCSQAVSVLWLQLLVPASLLRSNQLRALSLGLSVEKQSVVSFESWPLC